MASADELQNLRNLLSQRHEETAVELFLSYCEEEQYEIANIEEDIEDTKDSMIYEQMQSEMEWNAQQTRQFIQSLQDALHPPTPNISTPSHPPPPPPSSTVDDNASDTSSDSIYTHDEDINHLKQTAQDTKTKDELQPILDALSKHYDSDIIQIFNDFCTEQEV